MKKVTVKRPSRKRWKKSKGEEEEEISPDSEATIKEEMEEEE